MKAVHIADLKSRLSRHLHAVRRGEVITVMDRATPVARIVPFEPAGDLVITPPSSDARPIGRFRPPPRDPALASLDPVELLVAERQSHR